MNVNHPMNHEETAASLSGGAKTNALHALRVLSESAEAPASEETETPPLPAHLRDLWQETYGGNAAPAPKPEPVTTREGWVQRLWRFPGTPRAAWAGGLAAAAVVAIVVFQQDPAVNKPDDSLITRGTSHKTETSGSGARLIVVAAADKAGPLLKELARAYPSRTIERADSTPSGVTGNVVIIDAASRQIRRADQPAAAEISGDPLANPESVITAIEGLDEPEPR